MRIIEKFIRSSAYHTFVFQVLTTLLRILQYDFVSSNNIHCNCNSSDQSDFFDFHGLFVVRLEKKQEYLCYQPQHKIFFLFYQKINKFSITTIFRLFFLTPVTTTS